jgi:phosphohistidine phosphatase
MKRIVLVRHATAVETGPQGSDFHRRLKKRGRREAAIMADRTAAITGTPDLMVTSPADRAADTARAFADRLGYPIERVVVREQLYGGLLPEDFLRIINDLDDAHASVMIFGHDPSFSEFAAFLVRGFSDLVPKAGVVVIDVDRKSWKRVRAGDGSLVAFERPPAPELQRRIEEDLVESIARELRGATFSALASFGIPENREVVKAVARAAVRVAKAVRPYAVTPGPSKPRRRTAARKPKRGGRG